MGDTDAHSLAIHRALRAWQDATMLPAEHIVEGPLCEALHDGRLLQIQELVEGAARTPAGTRTGETDKLMKADTILKGWHGDSVARLFGGILLANHYALFHRSAGRLHQAVQYLNRAVRSEIPLTVAAKKLLRDGSSCPNGWAQVCQLVAQTRINLCATHNELWKHGDGMQDGWIGLKWLTSGLIHPITNLASENVHADSLSRHCESLTACLFALGTTAEFLDQPIARELFRIALRIARGWLHMSHPLWNLISVANSSYRSRSPRKGDKPKHDGVVAFSPTPAADAMFSDTSEDSVEQRDFDSASESYADSWTDDGRENTTNFKSRRSTLLTKAKEGKVDRYERNGMIAFRRLEFSLLVRFKTLDNAFAAIDLNSNGKISLVEWLKAMGELKIKGISLPVAKMSFDTICRYRSCNEISATDLKAFCFNQSKCWKYLSHEAKNYGARVDRIVRHFRRRIADRFDSVREAFRAMDYNDDHEMAYNEFLAALDQWGLRAETPTCDIRFLFDALDIDSNGKLSWLEFEHLFQKQALDDVNRRGLSNRVVEDLKKFEARCLARFSSMETAFSIMDVNCDQHVEYQEFLTALRRWNLPDDEIDYLWNIIDFKYLGKVSLRDLRRLLFRVRFQEGRAPRVSPPRRTRVSLPCGVSYAGIDEWDPADRQVATPTAETFKPQRVAVAESSAPPIQPPNNSTPTHAGATEPAEEQSRRPMRRAIDPVPHMFSPRSLTPCTSPKSVRCMLSPVSGRKSPTSVASPKGTRPSTAEAAPATRKKKLGVLEKKSMSLVDLRRHWKATNVDLKSTYDNGPPEVLQTLLSYHTPTNRITRAHKKKVARMALRRSPRPWTHLLPRTYTDEMTMLVHGARARCAPSLTHVTQGAQSIARLRELKIVAREKLCKRKKSISRAQMLVDMADGLQSAAIDAVDGQQGDTVDDTSDRLASSAVVMISPARRETESLMSSPQVQGSVKREKNVDASMQKNLRSQFTDFKKGMQEEREYVEGVLQCVKQKHMDITYANLRKERYGSKWNAQTAQAKRLRKKCRGAANTIMCISRGWKDRKNGPRLLDGTFDAPVDGNTSSTCRVSRVHNRSDVQQEINAQLEYLSQDVDVAPQRNVRTNGRSGTECESADGAHRYPVVDKFGRLAASTAGLTVKTTREKHMKAVGALHMWHPEQAGPSPTSPQPKESPEQWSITRSSAGNGEKDLATPHRASDVASMADKALIKEAAEVKDPKAPGALTLKFRAAILEAGMLHGGSSSERGQQTLLRNYMAF